MYHRRTRRQRTAVHREMDGRITIVIDHVSHTISEFTFRQFSQQVLDVIQAIVARERRDKEQK